MSEASKKTESNISPLSSPKNIITGTATTKMIRNPYMYIIKATIEILENELINISLLYVIIITIGMVARYHEYVVHC